MIGVFVWWFLLFFAVISCVANCEIVHKWEKKSILPSVRFNSWRATSFALTKDKMFLNLIDANADAIGHGVVGVFNRSSTISPTVSIFPYPNFYKINDPERGRITTPIAIRTDECERLWLLDSAVENIPWEQRKGNPGIYVFNTKNSQLVRSFNVPVTQWTTATFFVTFVVDIINVNHDCEESFGYFADFNRFHLLTYDFLRNKSELKSHPFFSPDPLVYTPEEVLFNREHQDLNGIYGLALAKNNASGMKDALYFHPLASTHEFKVDAKVLRSEGNINYNDVEVYKDKGENSQAGVSIFDPETDTIFFAELQTKKIGAFKVKSPGNGMNTTYYRYDFNLKSGRIVDLAVSRSELWALVDDKDQIVVHKLPIANITDDSYRDHHKSHPKPQAPAPPASASQRIYSLGFLHLALFTVFLRFCSSL